MNMVMDMDCEFKQISHGVSTNLYRLKSGWGHYAMKKQTADHSVVDPKLFFSDPDPDPTLILISDPDPDSDPDPACF